MKNNQESTSNDILNFYPRPFKLFKGLMFNEKDHIVGHFGTMGVEPTEQEIKLQEKIILALNSLNKDSDEIVELNDLKYIQSKNLWIEIYNDDKLIFTIADQGILKTGNSTVSERTKNQILFLKWFLEMISPTNNSYLSTEEDRKTFANALINPPFPNEKLKEAKENHNKNIKE